MKIIGNKKIIGYYCLFYFTFLLDGLCERVLPAADFDSFLILPSRRTFEAALAALFEVPFFGVLVSERALPEAVFDIFLVFLVFKIF